MLKIVPSKILRSSVSRMLATKKAQAMQGQVMEILSKKGVFSQNALKNVCDKFFNQLLVEESYYNHFNKNLIAEHVHSLIAAQKLALTTSGDESGIWLVFEKDDHAFYCCKNDKQVGSKIEKIIDQYIKNTPEGYSFEFYLSDGKIGKSHMNFYFVTRRSNKSSAEQLAKKSEQTVNRYNSVLDEIRKNPLIPVIRKCDKVADGTTPVVISFNHKVKEPYVSRISEIVDSIEGLKCKRFYAETFEGGNTIYTLYVKGREAQIEELMNKATLLTILPETELNKLLLDRSLTGRQVLWAYAATKFTYYFNNELSEEFKKLSETLKGDQMNLSRLIKMQNQNKKDIYTTNRIFQTVANYTDIIRDIYTDFRDAHKEMKKTPAFNTALFESIKKKVDNNFDRTILESFLLFNASVLKTNMFADKKGAVSFRLEPNVFFKNLPQYADKPFGIFLVVGREFNAFHVRMADIARGGIRVIKSISADAYRTNCENVFTENYGLAWTQHKKNKDIPEGGSKGTILLNPEFQSQEDIDNSFKKYVDSLLDIMLMEDKKINDFYRKEEILFLGPDENSAHLMDWAALHSKTRNFRTWKAITTGKHESIGGIPHDVYGMTTASTHQSVLCVLDKLGMDESKITKIMTGGPDGDLGSNEILVSKDKIKAVVDGSGVLYDPEGIDRTELVKLAKQRKMIQLFDVNRLSKQGFKVKITDFNVKLPNGYVVENGLSFRNNFHINPLFEADLFVPCGGRPASLNINNVHKILNKDGTPKVKIIVEGANLFITPEARLLLESKGVILYKDATANKGGVTSSSCEVLASLAMTNEEFSEHMQVHHGKPVPQFYKDYVEYVIKKVKDNARMEVDCIWDENKRTGTPRSVLTDILSNKINNLNEEIAASPLYDNEVIRKNVLLEALPSPLLNLLGVDTCIKRVPDNYMRAVFSVHLASKYVYSTGLNAPDFKLFEFIQKYAN